MIFRLTTGTYFVNEFKEDEDGDIQHYGYYYSASPTCVYYIEEYFNEQTEEQIVILLVTGPDGSLLLHHVDKSDFEDDFEAIIPSC